MTEENNRRPKITLDQEPLFKTDSSTSEPQLDSHTESIQIPARVKEIEFLARFEVLGGKQKNIFRALKHFYVHGCAFGKDLEHSLKITKHKNFF